MHNMDSYLPAQGSGKKLTAADVDSRERCEKLIIAALKSRVGGACGTDISCDVMTGDLSCTAGLRIHITDVPNEITWICPCCGTIGVIKNWRKSPVCRAAGTPAKTCGRESATQLTLPAEYYSMLEKSCEGHPELMMLLSMAEVTDADCSFHISEYDRYRLLEIVSGRSSVKSDGSHLMLEERLRESIRGIPGY